MKADEFLGEKGVEFEVVVQDNPTLDCDDAAKERGVETSEIVKSLIVERDGEKLHVLVPGDREISEKKFGESRLLPPEESRELTGFESGTVHPFSTEIKHLVDERVLEKKRLSFTTGSKEEGVIIKAEGFAEALEKADFEYKVEDIVVTNEEDIQELAEEGIDIETASFICEKGYRRLFIDLSKNYDSSRVAEAIEKMNRQETGFDAEDLEKLLERSEGETHMLKLAEELAEEGELPEEDQGFDTEQVVENVLEENPEAVEDYRDGRESALNYLMGAVMEETNGRAEASKVKKLLKDELG